MEIPECINQQNKVVANISGNTVHVLSLSYIALAIQM